MSYATLKASERAGRFTSFAEFHTQVVTSDQMMYGWVDDKFYQLYPGGRCVDYTAVVAHEVERREQREAATEAYWQASKETTMAATKPSDAERGEA